mgnify:CR=1 FL=1
MIGYVLLITAAIAMSFIVYSWMKTYVPKGELKCPDDVSMTITDTIRCTDAKMIVTIKNNGLFNIDGYTIKGDAYKGAVGVGKKDLYEQGYFYFGKPCKPQEKDDCISLPFGSDNLTDPLFTIKEVEITPIRAQSNAETGKNETIICGNAITKKTIEDCIIRLKN